MTIVGLSLALAAISACAAQGFDAAGDDQGGDDDVPPGTPDAAPTPDAPPQLPPRVSLGMAAEFKFKGQVGPSVTASGVTLTLKDPLAATFGAEGITFTQPTLLLSDAAPVALMQECHGKGELTLEAWLTPQSVLEQPTQTARVLSLGQDAALHNFALIQNRGAWQVRLRSTTSDGNGNPAIEALNTVKAGRQHVVFTRNKDGLTAIYVDGVAAAATPPRGGTFDNWILSYVMAVGNDVSANRPWLGTVHLVGVYCRALSATEVAQNYAAGI
jgi:hypothetical protein